MGVERGFPHSTLVIRLSFEPCRMEVDGEEVTILEEEVPKKAKKMAYELPW